MKPNGAEATRIWKQYQNGVDWHNKNSMYSNTDTYFDMVQGDQWAGIESGDEKLSSHDFISGVVEHKVAMVAMNAMTINFSSLNTGENQQVFQSVCEELNAYAASKWELTKMDTADWDIVNAACITGDAYLFFYNSNLDHQIIDRTNIYFSDEQEQDIQKQKRVIIYERRFVSAVKEDAKANKIDEMEIESIVSDEDTNTLPKDAREEVSGEEKCSCLLCIEKRDGKIFISRSTQTVVYQPETEIVGLTKIPIAKMIWYPKRGSSRGIGEVKRLLNNQINSNKLLYRREESIKLSSFPKPVVNAEMVTNTEDAKKVGTLLKIKGLASKVSDAFGYVAPQAATAEPANLQTEYITMSRDLANAGDNATGNINAEQASGAAIIAVRDQQAIATNKPQAYHKQFIEDIAAIWIDTWTAYNPNGMTIEVDQDGVMQTVQIPSEVLSELKVNIRIDVSPEQPYSKYAYQQKVDNIVNLPWFDNTERLQEYHDLLDDSDVVKGKLQDLIDKRNADMQEQMQLEQAMAVIEQQKQTIAQLTGTPVTAEQGQVV